MAGILNQDELAQASKLVAQILGSADILGAFAECNAETQRHAKQMIRNILDPESDEDDRYLAAVTLQELLFPYDHERDGMYGMDLHEAEQVVQTSLPADHPNAAECAEAVKTLEVMDREEEIFAVRLDRMMKERGISQSDLARRIGVGQPAIAMMLKRECRPQKRTVERLATALEVTANDLWPGFAG